MPLAISVPESASAPLTMMVPLLKVSTSAPALIVAPLKVSAAPLKTLTVMPALTLLTAKAAPEPTSSVAPDSGLMFAPALVPRQLEGAAAGDGQRIAAAVAADGAAGLRRWRGRLPRSCRRTPCRPQRTLRVMPLLIWAPLRKAPEPSSPVAPLSELQPIVAGVGADKLDGAAARHRRRAAEHAAGLDNAEPAGLDRRARRRFHRSR